MNDHFPECGMNDAIPVIDLETGVYCCCDRLRTRQERTLLAARDAVAAVTPWSLGVALIDRDDALAAIDALRSV